MPWIISMLNILGKFSKLKMALCVVMLKLSNIKVDMQLWYFNGGFIVNKRSCFVLDAAGWKCQNGTKIIQYQKQNEPALGAKTDNSTNIHLWEKHGGKNQQFILQKWDDEIFVIILRYIYSGKLSLKEIDPTNIIKLLVAANELSLQELVTYIQSFLIENKANWMKQNFDLIYQTSYEIDSFLDLQSYYNDLISNEPDIIFKSPQITVIQNDNLQISEIQVWEHVLKWGVSQNSAKLPSNLRRF
ncbi:BTB/POZ protein [Rhizophagus irregularis DAOM 181602=DAOM 197198]|nr:BTB/POZ protein [Rhizophagus irregularis DAOM 181602=DAOM 197198]